MNRYLPRLAALALSTCLAPACLAAFTATAETTATALGQVYVNDLNPAVRDSTDSGRDVVQTGSATASASTGLHAVLATADAGGGGHSWAQVAGGGLRLKAGAIGSALFLSPANAEFARIIGRSNAYAGGSFSDGMTFFMPSLAVGAPLVLRFSVDVSGSLGSLGQLAPGASGYSTVTEMRWNLALGDVSDGRSETEYNANGDITRGAPATGFWSFNATVANGVTTTLNMSASVGAAAQGGIGCRGCGAATLYAEGSSNADFSHTFAWNGIQGATDAAGNSLDLADLQVASSSGFDYRSAWAAPVPELSSPGLMAIGLLLLAAYLRQRRTLG